MAHALFGDWGDLDLVGAKAALLFLLALVGLRVSARRTLAELSPFDFVTAVAVGAIVGRVPNASTTSFAQGAVTLLVLLVLHYLVSSARIRLPVGGLLDHRPVVVVRDGQINERALRRRQLSRADLDSLLRIKGEAHLANTELVILEPSGAISVFRSAPGPADLLKELR